ncbi:hypothetical protein GW17_00005164 [Ensete ventricosum]|nr:hypothetical protein GW17_00005164 [Ensete ventricosum]
MLQAMSERTPVESELLRWSCLDHEAGKLAGWLAGWLGDSGGWSGHVELVPALAPPRLRVVLRHHRPARRHRHVDRVARRAVAALGRAQRRIRSRPSASAQLPTPPRRRLLRPPASSWHQRHTRGVAKMCREQRPGLRASGAR